MRPEHAIVHWMWLPFKLQLLCWWDSFDVASFAVWSSYLIQCTDGSIQAIYVRMSWGVCSAGVLLLSWGVILDSCHDTRPHTNTKRWTRYDYYVVAQGMFDVMQMLIIWIVGMNSTSQHRDTIG